MVSLKYGSGLGTTLHPRLRGGLAVAEISVALLLLTVAGEFLQSYQNMLTVDPGFRPERVLVAGYQLPISQYPTNNSVETFNQTIIERLSHKSGVISAGLGNTVPSSGDSGMTAYTVEDERPEGWKLRSAGFGDIYGNYFETLGIPLLAGRTFTRNDGANSPFVVIVSESMARRCWPGEGAIGKRMHVGNPKKPLPWATVVGIVGNTRIGARDEQGDDHWYFPTEQSAILHGTAPQSARTVPSGGFIVLQTALPPAQMTGVVRETVADLDPLLALDQVQTMDDVLLRTEAPRRLMTQLIGAFAVVAMLLSFGGIYAVMSFAVLLRGREIAIRMALGAQRPAIAKLILRSGALLAVWGCTIGIVGSLAISRLVQKFLFGVTATNAWFYLASVVAMLIVAEIASLLPATRAIATDPAEALRSVQ
jgi:putative ABC transport system permease protein